MRCHLARWRPAALCSKCSCGVAQGVVFMTCKALISLHFRHFGVVGADNLNAEWKIEYGKILGVYINIIKGVV